MTATCPQRPPVTPAGVTPAGVTPAGVTPAGVSVGVSPVGDAAVRVLVHGSDPEAVWVRVHRLARVLNDGSIPGVLSAVPTYDAILVEFDLTGTDAAGIARAVRAADARVADADGADAVPGSRLIGVPTAFGGRHGPDLGWVAETVGMTPARVVELFCAADHVVRCLGGPAASAMMDGPPLGRSVPRFSNPKLSVPAGAVSLAGRQAVLGPVAAPSGWRMIGCTPLAVLRLDGDEIVPYAPGDRLRFVPIDEAAFDDLRGGFLTGGDHA